MKLDANWKVKSTPDLIDQLHEMNLLHFKDYRRALYGMGNYRLCGKYNTYAMKRSRWQCLDSNVRQQKFCDFLQNKNMKKSDVVVSTYSKFTVPALNTAKKPGQRTRSKSTKTLSLAKKRVKNLRKKMSCLEDDE